MTSAKTFDEILKRIFASKETHKKAGLSNSESSESANPVFILRNCIL
jgi:hypothetical protein